MALIRPIASAEFDAYGAVSGEFVITTVLECAPVAQGIGGILLREIPAVLPMLKDYDGDGPRDWAQRFDLARWGIFLATEDSRPVGGAAVAPPTPDMWPSHNRADVAVLWDLRVALASGGRGIGTALLQSCAQWARERDYAFLVIETQNTNVPACRFYARAGCELAEIRRFGYEKYPDVAHEAMLIWQLLL
jgi:GNAT superfamily N-acetyltransferase